jgi:hypothetical protein
MVSSGTTAFSLDIGEIVDEAFGRIGVSVGKITTEHLISARRSLNLLQIEWENKFPLNWKIDEFSFTIVGGTATYSVSDTVSSVARAIYRDLQERDFVVRPISRADYFSIYDKSLTGTLPNQFFFDKEANTVTLFPVPTVSGETFKIIASVVLDDASKARFTLDTPRHFYDAVCAGLAYKLSEKYAPSRIQEKQALYQDALNLASKRDDEDAPVSIKVNFSGVW